MLVPLAVEADGALAGGSVTINPLSTFSIPAVSSNAWREFFTYSVDLGESVLARVNQSLGGGCRRSRRRSKPTGPTPQNQP